MASKNSYILMSGYVNCISRMRPVVLEVRSSTEMRHPAVCSPRVWVQATFEDELIGEAKAKRHSTTGEAVSIGQRAGAYRTILTHFSQRYAKLPVIDDSFRVRGRRGSGTLPDGWKSPCKMLCESIIA